MDKESELLRRKKDLIGQIRLVAEEELSIALIEGDVDFERLNEAIARRAEYMAQVEAIDAQSVSMSGFSDPGGEMHALLEKIMKLDGRLRAVLEDKLSEYGASIKDAANMRKGVGAYLGVQDQMESVYIDKKQ